jgi:hypothetical protein
MKTTMMSKNKKKALPVIIRYEGKGKATRANWHMSDLIAIFPTIPGNDAHTMQCYSTVGEHSVCTANYAGTRTKPATNEQITAMLKVLKARGYDNVRVVSRASSHHFAERRGEEK